MDAQVESHIRSYGYWGVFLWAVLGGEESILVAVWLVKEGFLSLPGVIGAAACGGAVGDQIYFYLARRYGWVRLRRSARFRQAMERAEALLHRYGPGVVLASRFLAGLRITIPLVCGTLGMSPLTYSLLNLASAVLWASFYGLMLSFVWSTLAVPGRRIWVGAVVLAVVALVLLIRRRWRRASARPVAREEHHVGIGCG